MKPAVVALCALALVASVSAGTSNPITISAGVTLNTQWMNATGGNLYSFDVSSSRISSFYEYHFRALLAPLSYVTNQQVTVAAYWKTADANNNLVWTAMTPTSWYALTSDGVATQGAFNVAVDPKALFDALSSYSATNAPSAITIGFLVSTSSTNAAVLNGVFSATLTETQAPQAVDANGDVPLNSNSRAFTGSCAGTSSRCMLVANMQFHDHEYLIATTTVTSGQLSSATMRNAATLSFDDTEYFNSGAGPLSVRTCLTNSSCEIVSAYYYLELRSTSTQTADTQYSVTWTTRNAASAASASLLTVVAAAALAVFASRS